MSQTENTSVKKHAYRNKNWVRSDMDSPVIAEREGRERHRRSGSPSANCARASEVKKRRERSASPCRAESTAKRRRRERSPVRVKTSSLQWEQDFALPSPNLLIEGHALGPNGDSSTAMLPNNSPTPRQEEPSEEEHKGEQVSPSFKLVERLLKNVAAGATLLPSWEEQLRMMVECTEQELGIINAPITSGSGLWTYELQSIQEVRSLQEPEVATLVNPLESFHISEPSSDTKSGSSGLVSPVEDGGNIIPPELADVTLKPAIWGKHEVEAEDTDDDEDEDEENTCMLGPYDPPTYGAAPPSPPYLAHPPVRAIPYPSPVTCHSVDSISRYWKPNKGRRFQPYHPRASRPSDAYATGAPESSESGRMTLGSIILEKMKEDLARESSDVDCSGKRPLSRGKKNYWSPLTQRKGIDIITHNFKKLVLDARNKTWPGPFLAVV